MSRRGKSSFITSRMSDEKVAEMLNFVESDSEFENSSDESDMEPNFDQLDDIDKEMFECISNALKDVEAGNYIVNNHIICFN